MQNQQRDYRRTQSLVAVVKEKVSVREASAEFRARQGAVQINPDILKRLSINEIATVVRQNWPKVYFGAVPYLEAMQSLRDITDSYGADSGSSIVNYFLSNATTWRGEVARAVKKELNDRVKNAS